MEVGQKFIFFSAISKDICWFLIFYREKMSNPCYLCKFLGLQPQI